ncbi:hypothetical protein ABHF91_06545 [Pseudaeromonas sp. ZJS20]|uniref:hypothetical protein n=1 Tax=Pseudaeromonas aegiceratis TaxID=3153928 RepID=UPI00390CAA74
MLLDTYEQNGLLLNMNFKEPAATGLTGYRGELVLKPGEVADNAGRRKPPEAVLKAVVMLAGADKLALVAGLLDDAADLPLFFALYGQDVAAETKLVFFVANLPKPALVNQGEFSCELVPLPEGIVWNELVDMVYLEKSDFKGQTSGEKINTVYEAFAGYQAKSPLMSWEEVLAGRIEHKRETRGAL